MHRAMAVIILLRRCQLFEALIMTLKIFEFLNFVAEGYRLKLNHGENFPIYGIMVKRMCNEVLLSVCV